MFLASYEVLSEVGRGGMGVVFRARSPEGRDVAVKVVHAQGARTALPRLERERRLLAALGEELGFVPLLDAGEAREGPYLVMPFVAGGTLRDRLRERGRLTVDDAVALGIQLARALGAAHARGIVHRDLKPENVLFTAGGQPLVADLGLAKHFTSDAPGASQSASLSKDGAALGTAGYMAPEQMNDAKSVGPRADVFGLGAMLFETLAGRPPFASSSIHGVMAAVATNDRPALRALRSDTPRWLVAVVDRALHPDPARRFADGQALARALETRDAGTTSRAPWLAIPVALAAVTVALVLTKESPTPEPERKVEAAALATSSDTAPRVERETHDGRGIYALARTGKTRLLSVLGQPRMAHIGAVARVAFSSDDKTVLSAGADRRIVVWDGASRQELACAQSRRREIRAATFAENGLVAAANADGSVELFDMASPSRPPRAFEGAHAAILAIDVAPDGKRAIAACRDSTAVFIDLVGKNDKVLTRLDHPLLNAAYARGGRAATVGEDGFTVVWEPDRVDPGFALGPIARATAVTWIDDGSNLAVADGDGRLIFYDVGTNNPKKVIESHPGGVLALATSKDRKRIASAGNDGDVRVWELDTNREIARFPGVRHGAARTVAFSHDGARVVAGYAAGAVEVWEIAQPSGSPIARGSGHDARVVAVAASGDGTRALSASADGTAGLWDLASGARVATLGSGTPIRSGAIAPDGARAAVGREDGAVEVWDLARSRLDLTAKHDDEITGLAFSAGRVISTSRDRTIGMLEAEIFRRPFTGVYESSLTAVLATRSRMVVGDDAGRIVVIDQGQGSVTFTGHRGRVNALALIPDPLEPVHPGDGPDGRSFLSAGEDGSLRVWSTSATTKPELTRIDVHPGGALGVAVAPAGDRAISVGADRTIAIVDLGAKRVLERIDLAPVGDSPTSVAFAGKDSFLVGTERGVVLRFSAK
jgi:WD40 repeat protein